MHGLCHDPHTAHKVRRPAHHTTADLGSFLDLLSIMPQAFLAIQGKQVN